MVLIGEKVGVAQVGALWFSAISRKSPKVTLGLAGGNVHAKTVVLNE